MPKGKKFVSFAVDENLYDKFKGTLSRDEIDRIEDMKEISTMREVLKCTGPSLQCKIDNYLNDRIDAGPANNSYKEYGKEVITTGRYKLRYR